MSYFELNIDGLVGPTHHYAGLSAGNIASTSHALSIANPASAALQGLKKMRLLHHLGIRQAVVPPHQRPNLALLSSLGFTGSTLAQITQAKKVAPELLSACFSAASMWTANMATVSSSLDTHNKRIHFTTANLIHNIHRSQEADFSSNLLQQLFPNPDYFEHHLPLTKTNTLSDEGAANHNRLCSEHGQPGVNLFVYGKRTLPTQNSAPRPKIYPARQTLEAQQTIARLHQLAPNKTLFAQQSPQAIDAGVFHNDVISVANESVFLVHEDAFFEQARVLSELKAMTSFPLQIIEISRQKLSLKDAVNSYLFNSQLITKPNGNMALIAPHECEEHPGIQSFVNDLILDDTNRIEEVHYLNLKQSMQNGGGPACLRLRVPLHQDALNTMHQGVLITDRLLDSLENWVKRHYRTRLHANDLDDPLLITECFEALDELTRLLHLGAIYPFQCDTN